MNLNAVDDKMAMTEGTDPINYENRGDRPDVFSLEELVKHLKHRSVPSVIKKISLVESIDSTNSFLLRASDNYLPLIDENGNLTQSGTEFNFSVKAAETQNNGRGRLGRSFVSPQTTGIYFSFSLVKKGGITDPSMITVGAAVGVCRPIEKTYGVQCKIKWVNDIYCGTKKVCGILTEGIFNSTSGKVEGCICGIGINILSGNSFDSELKSRAGGILDGIKSKNKISRVKLLANCLDELLDIFDSEENIISEYRERSFLAGKTVTVTPVIGNDKSSYKACAIGISENAGLLVKLDDGTTTELTCGEVTLHEN